MSIEERDIEEQFFKSIQFNYGKPTTKETIMNFADLIRTDQRNKDAEKCKSKIVVDITDDPIDEYEKEFNLACEICIDAILEENE